MIAFLITGRRQYDNTARPSTLAYQLPPVTSWRAGLLFSLRFRDISFIFRDASAITGRAGRTFLARHFAHFTSFAFSRLLSPRASAVTAFPLASASLATGGNNAARKAIAAAQGLR